MSNFFAIRNVDSKTKEFIIEYAKENEVSVSQALRQIVYIVKEHAKEQKPQKKKYRSFFEIYDKVAFKSGDPNLSKNVDKILYGKRD